MTQIEEFVQKELDEACTIHNNLAEAYDLDTMAGYEIESRIAYLEDHLGVLENMKQKQVGKWKEHVRRLEVEKEKIISNYDIEDQEDDNPISYEDEMNIEYYNGMLEGLCLAASIFGRDELLTWQVDEEVQEQTSGPVQEPTGADSSYAVNGSQDIIPV